MKNKKLKVFAYNKKTDRCECKTKNTITVIYNNGDYIVKHLKSDYTKLFWTKSTYKHRIS